MALYPSGKGPVCKTVIDQFDSDWRLLERTVLRFFSFFWRRPWMRVVLLCNAILIVPSLSIYIKKARDDFFVKYNLGFVFYLTSFKISTSSSFTGLIIFFGFMFSCNILMCSGISGASPHQCLISFALKAG